MKIKLIYCGGKEPQVPDPYTPVMAFIRKRNGNTVTVSSLPCVHTGNYDPIKKESGLPYGVWMNLVSGAVVEPVAWLSLADFTEEITQEFLRRLEKEVKIILIETGHVDLVISGK